MKRFLTSLCGVLLLGSLIYSTTNLKITEPQSDHSIIKSVSNIDTFFEGTVISLNVFFLFVFLMSILAMIREEDKNEKKNNPLLQKNSRHK